MTARTFANQWKLMLLLPFLWISGNSVVNAQGLNFESELNEDYWQTTGAVLCEDEYTWLAANTFGSGSFSIFPVIVKMDTLGNTLAKQFLHPFWAEVILVDSLVEGPSGVYLSGYGHDVCDVMQGGFSYVVKLDPQGAIIWSRRFWDAQVFPEARNTIFPATSGSLLVQHTSVNGAMLYQISNTGSIIDSLSLARGWMKGIALSSTGRLAGFRSDSLFLFDNAGAVAQTRVLAHPVRALNARNDTFFLLTSDSLYLLTDSLTTRAVASFPSYPDYSRLKLYGEGMSLISRGTSHLNILSINLALQLTAFATIPFQGSPPILADANLMHLSTAIEHPLKQHTSVRLMDYSLMDATNSSTDRSDIGIIDFLADSISVIASSYPGVYTANIHARVLLKNHGPEVLQSCHINHWQGWGICNDAYLMREATGLNLSPGSMVWVNLGWLGSITNLYGIDTLKGTYCFFTSHPNGVADTHTLNDEYCGTIILGYVGMEEKDTDILRIYPNPADDVVWIENPGIPQPGEGELHIYDATGRRIRELPIDASSDQIILDCKDLNAGFYLLELRSDAGRAYSAKLMVR